LLTKNIEKNINKTKKTIKEFFNNSLSAADDEDVDTKNSLYVRIVRKYFKRQGND